MSNCLFEATLQKIEAVCGCTPKYFVDIVEGFEACVGPQKQCMNKLIGAMGEARSVKMNGLEVKRFVPRLYILGNKS
jgi:hypothetical protein